MNTPELYYKDGSYDEVATPRGGDIICYFDNNGTENDYSDDINLHLGIVVAFNSEIAINNVCGSSNQVTVNSKWGSAGLCQHSGDYCPYTSPYGGTADYVKYYRKHTHNYSDHYCACGKHTSTHDYHEPYTWLNNTQHKATCSCGETINQGHAIPSSPAGAGNARCLFCQGRAVIGFIEINSTSIFYYSQNGSFVLPNGIIILMDSDINDYINGTLLFFDKSQSVI